MQQHSCRQQYYGRHIPHHQPPARHARYRVMILFQEGRDAQHTVHLTVVKAYYARYQTKAIAPTIKIIPKVIDLDFDHGFEA